MVPGSVEWRRQSASTLLLVLVALSRLARILTLFVFSAHSRARMQGPQPGHHMFPQQPVRFGAKVVQKEYKLLSESLPEGILVRGFEVRHSCTPALLRFVFASLRSQCSRSLPKKILVRSCEMLRLCTSVVLYACLRSQCSFRLSMLTNCFLVESTVIPQLKTLDLISLPPTGPHRRALCAHLWRHRHPIRGQRVHIRHSGKSRAISGGLALVVMLCCPLLHLSRFDMRGGGGGGG